MDGHGIANILKIQGYGIKNSTRTSLTVLVRGNRYDAISNLVKTLSSLDARYDPSAPGSSIGAVYVDKVKILIKSEGKGGSLDVEARAIQLLHDSIINAMMENGGPITIKMKNRRVEGIVGVAKTNGTPKSDFHCVDTNNKPLIFISHKKGSKPTDFQQWGGLTEKEIASNSYVKKFEAIVKEVYGDAIPSGESLMAELPFTKDANNLKLMSVYGVDAPNRNPGINCVDVLIQGDPSLTKIGKNVYEFTSTGHIHYIPDIPSGLFEPVLAFVYKGDRTNLGVKGGRASIYPKGGRTFKRNKKLL